MRSALSRTRVKLRRSSRIISCPAAKGTRWLNPSAATVSPSCTNSKMASLKVVSFPTQVGEQTICQYTTCAWLYHFVGLAFDVATGTGNVYWKCLLDG